MAMFDRLPPLTERRRWLRTGFWICLCTVLLLAWLPVQDIGAKSDVVNHACAFATLFLLARFSWRDFPLAWLCLALLFLGGLIEIVQYFVGRDAAWHDVGSDVIGIVIGNGLAFLLARCRMRLLA